MKNGKVQIQIPEAFKEMFIPKRYKVFYGGRGGAKSHNFGRYLLVSGAQTKQRFLCARELQGSITDSVHKLLGDIIDSHGLNNFYEVQKATIMGRNGTEFLFKGLKHNATEIKSMEGVDKVWVEEAQKVSADSWEILVPTIRKEGSEILVSFNPKHPTDPTYEIFVANADENMLVKKVSWRDNPFFPEVLDLERKRLKINDPLAYAHVWEGEFDERHFGGIYATYVDQLRAAGRLCPVPYKPGLPVITAWDLGKSHSTAIWFGQVVGLQPRLIDYYENSHKDLDHYADVIKSKPYKNYEHYLPHDAEHDRLGMSGSISDQLKALGIPNKTIKVGRKLSRIEEGISLLKECYIDDTLCKDGVHALVNAQYKWDDARQKFSEKPEDNWALDGTDAFGYMAQVLGRSARKLSRTPPPPEPFHIPAVSSWMN